MSLELIAVDGCTLDHAAGSLISDGEFTITAIPDVKVSVEGNGVYVTPLSFTFTGGSATGFVDESVVGAGAIIATATKVKAGGILVMREGDSFTMTAIGVIDPTPTPPAPPTGPVVGEVEISVAGQTTVRAE